MICVARYWAKLGQTGYDVEKCTGQLKSSSEFDWCATVYTACTLFTLLALSTLCALFTAYTVYTVYNVFNVYIAYTIQNTLQCLSSMYACILLELYLNRLVGIWAKCWRGDGLVGDTPYTVMITRALAVRINKFWIPVSKIQAEMVLWDSIG